jgi:Zn-dependent oligopeptidase
MDIEATWNALQGSVCLLDHPADDNAGHGYTTFQHPVSDDYSAGYYSYLL